MYTTSDVDAALADLAYDGRTWVPDVELPEFLIVDGVRFLKEDAGFDHRGEQVGERRFFYRDDLIDRLLDMRDAGEVISETDADTLVPAEA